MPKSEFLKIANFPHEHLTFLFHQNSLKNHNGKNIKLKLEICIYQNKTTAATTNIKSQHLVLE